MADAPGDEGRGAGVVFPLLAFVVVLPRAGAAGGAREGAPGGRVEQGVRGGLEEGLDVGGEDVFEERD